MLACTLLCMLDCPAICMLDCSQTQHPARGCFFRVAIRIVLSSLVNAEHVINVLTEVMHRCRRSFVLLNIRLLQ